MKSRSHIFALITACVFLFCGCSDYLSLSKASTISNPQTEYDTALKEYLASLEPVTKLPALRSLSLSSGTAVPSLEPLAQTNLAVLDLGLGVGQSGLYKEIDYSPLSQLPDLVCLNLTNHTRVTTKFCKQILAHSPDLRFLNIQNTPASEGSALDVEYLRAYTEADLLKRLVNKLRNTFG